MDKYTYILKQDSVKKEEPCYYGREELELMTTFQLRDICWREKIINGIQSPLDKDELIRQILRFRGRKEHLFIKEDHPQGLRRLEDLLGTARIYEQPYPVKGCAKIIAYHGISIDFFDGFTIGYQPEIVDTNAFLVSGGEICAIFQIRQWKGKKDRLYLVKSAELSCRESTVKSYQLYCMDRVQSDWMYQLYQESFDVLPEHLHFYRVPVMDFQVRELFESNMPLAIDFGTTNTTAGTYLDSSYIDRLTGDPVKESLRVNDVNYVMYTKEDGEATPVFPSVVGVTNIEGDNIQYVFGHQANRLFHMSYIDEGFCVFYDVKRWISDPEKEEELVDRGGHRRFVKRKEIIRAFLTHVISCATQRFKCRFASLHISAPVKQKRLFVRLYKEILPEYRIEEEDMLDEGVAVLYNSISEMIAQNRYHNQEQQRALIIDCGGGTTDLSSCRFTIQNQRVSYRIRIATAYENGNTDFGGNNLTFRIMEFLKIALAGELGAAQDPNGTPGEIIDAFGTDIFRSVDEEGIDALYHLLDEAYQRAETVVPTRFKEYEHRSNSEYFAVKNNFYFLFHLAEQVKNIFYGKGDDLRIAISSIEIQETATRCLLADRFKLSVWEGDQLTVLKDIPTVYISIQQINRLLQGDIYGIIRQFIESPYESGELQEYTIMRLTGQSCKIDLFREALKEFIPGRIIESSRRNKSLAEGYELKLMCLNGAVKYLKDKKYGYADIEISNEQPAFPYLVTAVTHTGEERTLIHSLNRTKTWGYIARNMTDLTLQLYLKDTNHRIRHKYNCSFDSSQFQIVEAEDIVEKYGGTIAQDDVDSIVNKELRSFVLADEERWGFLVIPILRKEERLMAGPEQFFLFETESWMTNFFDGTK